MFENVIQGLLHRSLQDETRENTLKQVSVEEILIAQSELQQKREEQEQLRNKILLDRGNPYVVSVFASELSACQARYTVSFSSAPEGCRDVTFL